MQNKRVRDFMAIHYATLSPGQTIVSAAKTLLEYRQSAAPVVDEHKQLIGLISEADCMREALVEGYHNEGASLVSDFMTTQPESVSPGAELSAVAEVFLKNGRRMMPVVEADTLVGILSRQNILNVLVNKG